MNDLAKLIAEHSSNVVTEGAGTVWQTRVKCNGDTCEFYFAQRGAGKDPTGWYGAVEAHNAHLTEVVAAYIAEEEDSA